MSEDTLDTGENVGDAVPETVETEQPPEQQQEEQTVPLAALQSERAQRQQLQEELQVIKDNVALMQANQRQATPEKSKDGWDDLEDSDVLTVGEAKKLYQRIDQSHQLSIEELRMTQKHPDYQEVVMQYLPEVLKTNPNLRKTLEKTQDYELAYHLAKNTDTYRKDHKSAKKSEDAKRIMQNSQKAGNLSSVGASTPVSQVKKYKDMSNDEFKELVNRNMGVM